MFNNVGQKIQGFTKLLFWIDTIGLIIAGICMVAINDENIPFLLLSIFAAPLIIYISLLPLYGFGQLVEKFCDDNGESNSEKKEDEELPEL